MNKYKTFEKSTEVESFARRIGMRRSVEYESNNASFHIITNLSGTRCHTVKISTIIGNQNCIFSKLNYEASKQPFYLVYLVKMPYDVPRYYYFHVLICQIINYYLIPH